jgi:hypothetical protein
MSRSFRPVVPGWEAEQAARITIEKAMAVSTDADLIFCWPQVRRLLDLGDDFRLRSLLAVAIHRQCARRDDAVALGMRLASDPMLEQAHQEVTRVAIQAADLVGELTRGLENPRAFLEQFQPQEVSHG